MFTQASAGGPSILARRSGSTLPGRGRGGRRLGVLVGVVCGVLAPALAEEAAVPMGAALWPLNEVRLLEGPFRQAQETNRACLLRLDPDRLLAHVRENAGLIPKGRPYGGWDHDGSQCVGHYLTSLAHMSASTGDPLIRERVRYIVVQMNECQRSAGDGSLYGYASDKAWYRKLAAGEVASIHVAPWYVTHKLMAGLRDAYRLCDDQLARDVLVRMADWCIAVTARLTPDQWQAMLDREHGGPHEVLADVYALTGEQKYLELARKFTHRRVYEPLARGDASVLNGIHANTQFPKFIGYERIYELTGETPRHEAARVFWENVTSARSWANGGNSQSEFFFPAGEFPLKLADLPGPETCNTYNMLRLTQRLFLAEPSARLMDYYERALLNHVLASQDPETGGFAYHTPMRPGHYRIYSTPFDSFWCCVNTGMESHSKHGEMIYARSGDGLYVNLFIASEARWPEQGLILRQDTRFPDEARTALTLTLARPRRLALRLRWPAWVEPGKLRVTVNDRSVRVQGKPGEYVTLERDWQSGDRIQVELPMKLRAEPLPHSTNYVAFFHGPVLLAGQLGSEGLSPADFISQGADPIPRKALPMDDCPALITEPGRALAGLEPELGGMLRFRARGVMRPADVTLVPLFRLHRQRYAVYWPVRDAQADGALRARREQERREAATLEARTIDRVEIGEASSEKAHHLQGERTGSGPAPWPYARWRDASGWFAYDLKLPPQPPVTLRCVFWGGDVRRTFDVLVAGQVVSTVTLEAPRPGDYVVRTFDIPPELTAGRQQATVRFQAREGSVAGGVFDLRFVRPESGLRSTLPRSRRILYNLDGDSCMTLKAGRKGPGPMTAADLTNIVAELAGPGSQVDTLLVCVNAQVMYYPTKVGTLRGTLSTAAERAKWTAHERQRVANLQTFFDAGLDPYGVILGEAKRRGVEALLTFRVNDAHGNDFLRTAFWRDHPEYRFGNGALDFTHDAVRDYVFRLMEEAVQRYDCDGLELDFQRFPAFFKAGTTGENAPRINALVERVRRMLDAEGAKRGRRLVLAARAPSDFGQACPTCEQSLSWAKACDPAEWARRGWIDFLTVSEFLFTAETLGLKSWRERVRDVPIYAAIQPETKPSSTGQRCEFCLGAAGYRRFARERWTNGADGIYLFNFFTTREWADPIEPPFEVLAQIGDPKMLAVEDAARSAAPRVELIGVRKIWDAAPHNAFTDLLRHGGEWFCVFREGSGHIPGTNGVIRVLHSVDGAKWESSALVREAGIDLRDPKLSVMPDGRLMLLMGGSTYAGEDGPKDRAFVRARTRVAFSRDGREWSAPQPVSVEGEWLWRVTWHRGTGYGFGYTFLVPAKDVLLTLWRTTNGMTYERIARPKVPAACWPDETTVRFLADETMVALVRGEQPNRHAFVGNSRPPYAEWRWADTGHAAQGPNFVVSPGDRIFYAGRDFPAGAKTVLGTLTLTNAAPLLTLPSGGDTSYPGLVWHDGRLWMSYYASHEGKAAIYLGKVQVNLSE